MSNSTVSRSNKAAFTRLRLAAAVAAVTSSIALPALAQEPVAEQRRGYSLQLEEVVVTAQKREENYMSVPVTVNAFTAQDMANTGAANIQDIDDFMPGVEIGDGGATQVGITIRGLSSPGISSGQDPSVATFYDGSYMPRAVTSLPFTDIARTEVLKGPQGTLFGRNATAGVINIVPNNPVNELEGYVKGRFGNYDLMRMEGMINAPIGDNFAVRANVFAHERDGTVKNVGAGGDLRDEEYVAARISALWNISDYTDIQLSYDMEDRDEMPRQAIGVSKYAYMGSTDPFLGRADNDAISQEETRDMSGWALKLNHDFNDDLSLFGVVSYREWETTNIQEEDGTGDIRRYLDTNNIEDSDILYSELRFNYVNDRVNLIVGGNYSQEDVYQRTDIGLMADSYMQFLTGEFGGGLDDSAWDPEWLSSVTGIPADQIDDGTYALLSDTLGLAVLPPSYTGTYFFETMDNTGEFTNWGVFTDMTYQLTDTVRISAGLRYSADDKEYSWQTFPSDIDYPQDPARVNYDPSETGAAPDDYYNKFTDSDDWSKVTGRLVADWEFSDAAMLYASYATGYKSGGWNGQSFKSFVSGPFDPEDMTSYELGLKGDFFSDSLRLEVAAFHHELDGKQGQRDTKDGPDDPTASPNVVTSDVETDGIELIVQWNIIDSMRLTGMTTYRESEEVSDRYFNADGEPAGGDKEDDDTNLDYTLRFDWTPQIPMGFLLVHVDYVYIESPGPDDDEPIFVTGPWYFQDKKQLSARVSWSNDADNIEIALWGANLLDEEYAENPGGLAADNLGVPHTSIDDPLTYGIDLRYTF